MLEEFIKFKNVGMFFISLGMKVATLMVGMCVLNGLFFLSNFVE
jgi:hypothetical protein